MQRPRPHSHSSETLSLSCGRNPGHPLPRGAARPCEPIVWARRYAYMIIYKAIELYNSHATLVDLRVRVHSVPDARLVQNQSSATGPDPLQWDRRLTDDGGPVWAAGTRSLQQVHSLRRHPRPGARTIKAARRSRSPSRSHAAPAAAVWPASCAALARRLVAEQSTQRCSASCSCVVSPGSGSRAVLRPLQHLRAQRLPFERKPLFVQRRLRRSWLVLRRGPQFTRYNSMEHESLNSEHGTTACSVRRTTERTRHTIYAGCLVALADGQPPSLAIRSRASRLADPPFRRTGSMSRRHPRHVDRVGMEMRIKSKVGRATAKCASLALACRSS